MGGEAVLNTEELLEFLLHTEIALAAGVSVIRSEHGGLHVVTHGVHAGVSKHVQKDVAVVKLKGVVAGILDFLQPLAGGQQVQLLDDADLVHLQGDGGVLVESNLRHIAVSFVIFGASLMPKHKIFFYTLTLCMQKVNA